MSSNAATEMQAIFNMVTDNPTCRDFQYAKQTLNSYENSRHISHSTD